MTKTWQNMWVEIVGIKKQIEVLKEIVDELSNVIEMLKVRERRLEADYVAMMKDVAGRDVDFEALELMFKGYKEVVGIGQDRGSKENGEK